MFFSKIFRMLASIVIDTGNYLEKRKRKNTVKASVCVFVNFLASKKGVPNFERNFGSRNLIIVYDIYCIILIDSFNSESPKCSFCPKQTFPALFSSTC